jgi:hypothetical protein
MEREQATARETARARSHEDKDRLRIAEHEAAHAVAALKMGLTVAWVQVTPGFDEGVDFGAAVKVPDETLEERDLFAVCVATAAPSHLRSHREHPIGRHARTEASLAYKAAVDAGFQFDDVYDAADIVVNDYLGEIRDLARRLLEDGKVVFDAAYA